jgi:hypothetical protein
LAVMLCVPISRYTVVLDRIAFNELVVPAGCVVIGKTKSAVLQWPSSKVLEVVLAHGI